MTVAVVGGGVIGAGWIARLACHGVDVKVFDPDPTTKSRIETTVASAATSLQQLYDRQITPSSVTFCADLEGCVEGVSWVQECLPERLGLKHTVFQQLANV